MSTALATPFSWIPPQAVGWTQESIHLRVAALLVQAELTIRQIVHWMDIGRKSFADMA